MYLVMLLAVKRKLWAIFLPRGSFWRKHREAGLNLQGFWSLWVYAHLFSETLTLKTYRREWKLLSLYMFHGVIFILLIVSSLFLNLIAAQVVFSYPTYHIADFKQHFKHFHSSPGIILLMKTFYNVVNSIIFWLKGTACFDRSGYWMSAICLAKLWKTVEL